MSQTSGLTVRQHERREIELPVEFVVAEEHRQQVRLSSSSGADDEYTLRGHSVDISVGGLGFSCRHFLPRACQGLVRVYDPAPAGEGQDGSPFLNVAFEHRVKVRRVQMTSPEPTYFIGLSFIDPDPDIEQRISSFLHKIAPSSQGATDSRGAADA